MSKFNDADIQYLLEGSNWIFAKTMVHNPHEYTLRKSWDDHDQFEAVIKYIRQHGYTGYFRGRGYIQLNLGNHYYWIMGIPIERTTLINRKKLADYSIEYCHIYYDDPFGYEQIKSIEKFNELKNSLLIDDQIYQIVVMVDDYSLDKVHKFDPDYFQRHINAHNGEKSVIISESSLIKLNMLTLNLISDYKLQKNTARYIESVRHPCSLFIATWYLMRMGYIGDFPKIMAAKKLISILPEKYRPSEQKADEILSTIIGQNEVESRILRIYVSNENTA